MTAIDPLGRLREEVAAQEQELQVSREILQGIERLQKIVSELFNNEFFGQRFPSELAPDEISRRIRGFTIDQDAGSGHFDNEVWTGAALVSGGEAGVLLVEEHYPSAANKPTYFSEFDIASGELSRYREDDTNRGNEPLPGIDVMEGKQKTDALTRVRYALNRFADTYTVSYDNPQLSVKSYQFETEQLQ